MADSSRDCKENDKIMEELNDPESVSNHKRTIAASVPQPPVVVKEENDYDYTLYNTELLGQHSELDIKFEPDEEPQGHEGDQHDDDTCSAATIKIEIEIDFGEEANKLTETQPTVDHIVPETDSPSGFKEMTTDSRYIARKNNKLKTQYECKTDADNVTSSDYTTYKYKQVKENTVAKKYGCDLCSYIATRKKNIVQHLKRHNAKKPHSCNMCERTFTERYELKRHITTHTRPFVCEICSKNFGGSGILRIHMRSHTGEKPYACDMCDKKFTARVNLKKHISTHTGEKPYACSVCDKKYSHPSLLSEHFKCHATREKPVVCTICDKEFLNSRSLKPHMKIHTGEKPHACKLCDKKFALKSTLNKHIVTHTREKRYTCELCDKRFAQSYSLKKHISRHTDEKPV